MTLPIEGINPWRGYAPPSPSPVPQTDGPRFSSGAPVFPSNAANSVTNSAPKTDLEDDEYEDFFHEPDGAAGLIGEDGFTFDDFIDIINPLQHIPIVSSIYREITGDKIEPASRIAGGTLFGGPLGGGLAMANAIMEAETGADLGGHMMAFMKGESGIAVAEGTPSASASTRNDGALPSDLFDENATTDPVLDWARAQRAYQDAPGQQVVGSPPSGPPGATVFSDNPSLSETSSVSDWARAQLAARSALSV